MYKHFQGMGGKKLFVCVCTECAQGKYGEHCNKDCGIGCHNETCHRITGMCNCNLGWMPPLCDVGEYLGQSFHREKFLVIYSQLIYDSLEKHF